MLEKRDQTGHNTHKLSWRNVDKFNLTGCNQFKVSVVPCRHYLVCDLAVFVQLDVGLGDDITLFFIRGQVMHLLGDFTLQNFEVRSGNKPEFVDLAVCAK